MKKRWLLLILLCINILADQSLVKAIEEAYSEWRMVINIPEYKLYLYQGANLSESFPVAVGKPSEPSPVGEFYIANKVINPVWYPEGRKPVPPGPRNPLGRYWLGLNKKGYGIHGNNSPNSIGNPVSKGCFRMKNQDIERLFRIVPQGTSVTVKYTTVLGRVDAEQRAWLELFPDIYRRDNLAHSIGEVLTGLAWKYQPHYKALQELVENMRHSVVEVPRLLEVTGELTAEEAFLWNNDIYFEKMNFGINEVTVQAVSDQVSFRDYIGMKVLNVVSGGKYKCDLNLQLNLVNIRRFKSFINNYEIEDLGRYIKNGPYINCEKIARVMEKDLTWNREFEVSLGGQKFECVSFEGLPWLPVNEIKKIEPGSNFSWDEQNWVLKLYLKVD